MAAGFCAMHHTGMAALDLQPGIVWHVPMALACADAATDAAKRAGGGTCVVYAPGMAGDAADQVRLQLALRNAIERGELMLYDQPKVDAHPGKVHGLEALLRWRHPERGLVSRRCSCRWPSASA